MAYDEAMATVLCTHELLAVTEDARGRFQINTYGQVLRPGFGARFAEPRVHVQKTARDYARELQYRDHHRAAPQTAPGTARWYVGTMGVPGEERVVHAAREEGYGEGRNPTVDGVVEAAGRNAGTPTPDAADATITAAQAGGSTAAGASLPAEAAPSRPAASSPAAVRALAGRNRELLNPDRSALVFLYHNLAGIAPSIDAWVEKDTRVQFARPADKDAQRAQVRAELEAAALAVRDPRPHRLQRRDARCAACDHRHPAGAAGRNDRRRRHRLRNARDAARPARGPRPGRATLNGLRN